MEGLVPTPEEKPGDVLNMAQWRKKLRPEEEPDLEATLRASLFPEDDSFIFPETFDK